VLIKGAVGQLKNGNTGEVEPSKAKASIRGKGGRTFFRPFDSALANTKTQLAVRSTLDLLHVQVVDHVDRQIRVEINCYFAKQTSRLA
jgi:hypothetical protein